MQTRPNAENAEALSKQELLAALSALQKGDFSVRIPTHFTGLDEQISASFNEIAETNQNLLGELKRIGQAVGQEGDFSQRAQLENAQGDWNDTLASINQLIADLIQPTNEIARVVGAIAKGDFTQTIPLQSGAALSKGEFLCTAKAINRMVEQLASFASELKHTLRDIGTKGKLGGQAEFILLSGTWKDLAKSVNTMTSNLSNQVRNIAAVMTAVAMGDLSKKITVEAQGEMLALKITINTMVEQLRSFASEVTRVAYEVGTEGKLGGQAVVANVSGTWKDLTNNVNQLAANLTSRVRAITQVASAVIEGDFTQSIQVQASGEVAVLKDKVNEMISNLRLTTLKNREQDWLKTNLAKFSFMLQRQHTLETLGESLFPELAAVVSADRGTVYIRDRNGDELQFNLLACYGCASPTTAPHSFRPGEGRLGQCAVEKQEILMAGVSDDFDQAVSSRGKAEPIHRIALPIMFAGEVIAIMELGSPVPFDSTRQLLLDQLSESFGIVLHAIEADLETRDLLRQSSSLAHELQNQQQQLHQTNEHMEDRARLLALQKEELEHKNREVEQARLGLQEKAAQLALADKYKSQFLSNMSHELRNPLNNLLLLARQLLDNHEQTLTSQQLKYAEVIHSSGQDLLRLINDILDLSKINSGTVTVDVGELQLWDLQDFVERNFRLMAKSKDLELSVERDPALPHAMRTDGKRLEQILKNLLSNAFKFTQHGGVQLQIQRAHSGWNSENSLLNEAEAVVAFSVTDTGVGIPPEKQKIIFEAFQQADSGTNRKYGGTGLGLSISRELARLLGGEIHLRSAPGEGSVFTLYLPQTLQPTRKLELDFANVEFSVVPPEKIIDDRDDIQEGDRKILCIEDDADFAHCLLELARADGFKALLANRGERGLVKLHKFNPDAITLDLSLPDTDGWKILGRLKNDPATRHIPVTIISADDDWRRGLKLGAINFLTKPVKHAALVRAFAKIKSFIQPRPKRLLLVEPNGMERNPIIGWLGDGAVQTTVAESGRAALTVLKTESFDCMVLDARLPDMSGFHLLEKIKKAGLLELPIIVYRSKELNAREENKLQKLARSLFIKAVHSPERLLDEVALFLHLKADSMPEPTQQLLEKLLRSDSSLSGKKALVVDDDIRNIFAMTSLLERHGMEIVSAESGREAIEILKRGIAPDLALMDIMMPGFDGYHTIRAIRQMSPFKTLPIIAVTAKAMREDRTKCLQAGASDYVAKPVDTEQLLSTLRLWLYR